MEVADLTHGYLKELFSRYLEKYRTVRLVPDTLLNNGLVMRLRPMQPSDDRPGTREEGMEMLDPDTLPMLDLKAAGIEWDRTENTLRKSVSEFLQSHQFTVFIEDSELLDPVPTFLMLPMDGYMLMAGVGIMGLAAARPILRPYNFDPKKQWAEWRKGLPRLSILVESESGPIPGLDLSKPVSGWRGEILQILLPPQSPEWEAINAGVSSFWSIICYAEFQERMKKFWYSFVSRRWKKKREERISKEFQDSFQKFEEKLALV